jgi:hypothetical protein
MCVRMCVCVFGGEVCVCAFLVGKYVCVRFGGEVGVCVRVWWGSMCVRMCVCDFGCIHIIKNNEHA